MGFPFMILSYWVTMLPNSSVDFGREEVRFDIALGVSVWQK
jgi:hypothetical protein